MKQDQHLYQLQFACGKDNLEKRHDDDKEDPTKPQAPNQNFPTFKSTWSQNKHQITWKPNSNSQGKKHVGNFSSTNEGNYNKHKLNAALDNNVKNSCEPVYKATQKI